MDILSKLAAIPRGDATVEQRSECRGHALHLLLHGGEHPLRGAEVRRVARVEEVWMEGRAVEFAVFFESPTQVVGERVNVDRRDARFPLEHGCLLNDSTLRRPSKTFAACQRFYTRKTSASMG